MPDGRFLEVSQFSLFLYKSKKQFGSSFAFDAPTIWNELPDDVRSPSAINSGKKLKGCLSFKAFLP